MTLPSDWDSAAASGSKAKTGTWSGTAGATGRPRHWRLYASGGSTCHAQGETAPAWAASTAYSTGEYVNNDSGKVYRCTSGGTSAGSGGPTGTGTSITDSGATWDYEASSSALSLDAGGITSGQTVTQSTFTLTDGNT